jgi:hypothetical protein
MQVKSREKQQNPGKAVEKTIFTCDYCKKELSRAHTLKGHLIICKTKLKQEKEKEEKKEFPEIKEMKEKLQTMEKEVERLKEKPTTTIINSSTTNTNNNYGSIRSAGGGPGVDVVTFKQGDWFPASSQFTVEAWSPSLIISGFGNQTPTRF